MSKGKVIVSIKVLEGLEAVRLSGKTNMIDRSVVASLALAMGYPETAVWITKNSSLYSQGTFAGFVPADNSGEGGDMSCAD